MGLAFLFANVDARGPIFCRSALFWRSVAHAEECAVRTPLESTNATTATIKIFSEKSYCPKM